MGRREAIICLTHDLPANGVKHLLNPFFSFIFGPVSDALTTSELMEEISPNGRVEEGRMKCDLCIQLFSVRYIITFRVLFLLNCQFLHEKSQNIPFHSGAEFANQEAYFTSHCPS